MKNKSYLLLTVVSLILMAMSLKTAAGQTTGFTNQGKLTSSGSPANGTYDMQFKLYDALSNDNQIGATVTNASVSITLGIFAVTLDFGAGVQTSTTFGGQAIRGTDPINTVGCT